MQHRVVFIAIMWKTYLDGVDAGAIRNSRKRLSNCSNWSTVLALRSVKQHIVLNTEVVPASRSSPRLLLTWPCSTVRWKNTSIFCTGSSSYTNLLPVKDCLSTLRRADPFTRRQCFADCRLAANSKRGTRGNYVQLSCFEAN